MPECVIFSDRAAISLLVEAREQNELDNETGGVFLGYRRGKIWYVIECCDPGPKAIFRHSYFEYDHEYINHTINKLSRIYLKQLELLGLWHRHPGSLDRFSATDDRTNLEYAQLHPEGAISAIANIDPHFRLTIYEVTQPLRYRRVRHLIGDARIPSALLRYESRRSVMAELSQDPLLRQGRIADSAVRPSIASFQPAYDGGSLNRFSLRTALHFMLQQLPSWTEGEAERFSCGGEPEMEGAERILEALQSDIDYLDALGIGMKMRYDEEGMLELREVSAGGVDTGLKLAFLSGNEGRIGFRWQKQFYDYQRGMFQHACESYSSRGGAL